MKHRVLFILSFIYLFIFLCNPVGAQNRVAEIRKMYAEAREMVVQSNDPDYPAPNDLVITGRHMQPGAGMQNETIHYYALLDDRQEEAEEGDVLFIWRPYFITRKYNYGSREFYEEYLFDTQTGNLVFAFLQGENLETGNNDEARYYWDKDMNLIDKKLKGDSLLDDMLTTRMAYELTSVYNTLMNRNWE